MGGHKDLTFTPWRTRGTALTARTATPEAKTSTPLLRTPPQSRLATRPTTRTAPACHLLQPGLVLAEHGQFRRCWSRWKREKRYLVHIPAAVHAFPCPGWRRRFRWKSARHV